VAVEGDMGLSWSLPPPGRGGAGPGDVLFPDTFSSDQAQIGLLRGVFEDHAFRSEVAALVRRLEARRLIGGAESRAAERAFGEAS
jgi:hypothetical protein